jgi:hypothetical protein
LNRKYDISYELNLKYLFKSLLSSLEEKYHFFWYMELSHDFTSSLFLGEEKYNPNKGLTDEKKRFFYDLKKGLNIKQIYLNTDISKKHFLSIFKINGDIDNNCLNRSESDILQIKNGSKFINQKNKYAKVLNTRFKKEYKKKIIEKLDIDNDQLILIDFRSGCEKVSFKYQLFSMRGFDHPSENFIDNLRLGWYSVLLTYNQLSEGFDFWGCALRCLDSFRGEDLENYSFKPKKIVFFFGNDYDISYFISEGIISYENDENHTPGKTTLRGISFLENLVKKGDPIASRIVSKT